MPCYYPMKMFRCPSGPNNNGKWPLVSTEPKDGGIPVDVPCGRCVGCRLERSRQWSIRIMNEASLNEKNSFITLTYSDDKIVYGGNESGTLVLDDLQKFWKRLRKKYNGKSIRYFACGEYGGKTNRPHYHAALLGFDFEDKRPWSVNQDGDNLYTSANLDNIWGLGHCIVGALTTKSAAYVARYILGKKLGREKVYYEEQGIKPEFVAMSKKPGIGNSWFHKYKEDVITYDIQVVDGKETIPPKYYDKLLEKYNKEIYDKNKDNRRKHKFASRPENTKKRVQLMLGYRKWLSNRNKVREHITLQKIARLKRNLNE